MKIAGRRTDGAVLLHIGAGIAVVMDANRHMASRPMDVLAAQKLGPFGPADDSLDARRKAQYALDRSRTVVNLDMSYDERRDRVVTALRVKLGVPTGMWSGLGMMDFWVPQNGMGANWVVYSINGKNFRLGYAVDEASGAVTFDGLPEEVGATWETMGEREGE